MEQYEKYLEKIWELATIYGFRLIGALVILIVGWRISKFLKKIIIRIMTKAKIDATLVTFVGNLTYVALITFVILATLGKLGVQTTSFIAVIGAAGLAVGLALQGSLSNFAAGVLLILFRPFKVGDFIEAAGTAGTVEEIQIFTTQLKTPDNKTIIIPNASVTAGNIVNISTKKTRRVDLVFGIGYSDDIDQAKSIIKKVLDSDDRILDDPQPTIAVLELADSSVNFAVRPWVRSADYWDVYFSLNETIKKQFDAEGISIPFPQQDVHMYQHSE